MSGRFHFHEHPFNRVFGNMSCVRRACRKDCGQFVSVHPTSQQETRTTDIQCMWGFQLLKNFWGFCPTTNCFVGCSPQISKI